MNKHEILTKMCEELPPSEFLREMSDDEWYAWFEEAFDKGMQYERELAKDADKNSQ